MGATFFFTTFDSPVAWGIVRIANKADNANKDMAQLNIKTAMASLRGSVPTFAKLSPLPTPEALVHPTSQ